ncbi:MaoC like domain-containing protein [Haloechinothrix alba]|uniref:MaoC like domain-containing protein n=1 Tax=Haloechinothrix alba TaxID=664784 RepID=A0A238YIC4_9PSEU|nr:MaoC/PaaZ C-terminal domain-containing protein [Haloechinothrix alba]SNR70384.1 MaoC like domain-containing protein [Haloechinothrix alba]
MTIRVGDELPPLSVRVTRGDLVRYAGASLDFNPIHFSDRVASEVGLPGVIAHGMLTMGIAGRVVTEWVGDAGRVLSYATRFTRPVVVPDDEDGALVECSGTVTAVEDDIATVSITAKFEGRPVLGKATATVRLT